MRTPLLVGTTTSLFLLLSLVMASHHDGTVPSSPLRVAVLVEPSPFTYLSGYTNRFLNLFQHLDLHKDAATIITAEAVVQKRPEIHLNFPILYSRGFPLPVYRLMTLSCDWTLVVPRTLLRERPDLIHVTTPGMFVFSAILWSRLLQIPLVMSYHTHLPVYLRSYLPRPLANVVEPFVWWLLRVVYSLADVTLVTSTVMQQEFHRRRMPHTRLWPKAVDTTKFHPRWASTEWRGRLTHHGRSDDPCILLYVGRLASEKRLEDLKAVMDRLPSRYHLAIVGKGPLEEELQLLFAKDQNRTTFQGPLYGEDLSAAYASADIFITPSDSETLGLVVLEAMASGVPVVAAEAGGLPDMVEDGQNGFLVKPADVDGYVKAIQRIGLNKDSRRREMGQTARSLAETWTWGHSMAVLRQDIYQQLAVQNFHQRPEQRLWKFFQRKEWKSNDTATQSSSSCSDNES